MAFKTVLVHVDSDRRLAMRLDMASSLAARHGAHLVGLHILPTLRLPSQLRAEMGDEVFRRHRVAALAVAERLAATFKATADRIGATGAESRTAEGDPIEMLALHARYADLVVVGQNDPDDEHGTVPGNFAEMAALQCARPVLVVPYAGGWLRPPRTVLVAWNASREAARAATDALPYLQEAERVVVVAVNPRVDGLAHGARPGADVALWLSRHGVRAEAAAEPAVSIDTGAYLLSRAADYAADLIVMGAYGHSRARELVFGGVTQTMMREMTVPVLMSH
jgi:nucleotide-binding universal stress UspA family protein